MPEMTENQTRPHKGQRRKKNKETHNAVERHRKKKINAGINRIGELLPCSQALKQSKNMILDQAYRYITELKQQNDTLLLNGGEKVQAEEISRLRRQLEDLRKESIHYIELLKANGINFVDDPTIHWKGKLRRGTVAKVKPSLMIPEGIIIYSNGNVLCSAGEQSGTPTLNTDGAKRPPETVIVQPAADTTSIAKLAPGLASQKDSAPVQVMLTPPVSVPGLLALEQCATEEQSISNMALSASYVTFQNVPGLPTTSSAMPASTSKASITTTDVPPTTLQLLPPLLPPLSSPAVSHTSNIVTLENSSRIAQQSNIVSRGSTCDPMSLRTSSSGSTQTTWTTLQVGGSTIQPVCHPVPSTVPSLLTTSISANGLQGSPVLPPEPGPSIHHPIHVPTAAPALPVVAPPQPRSAVLPLVQTMQVLDMSTPAVTGSQNTHNSKVVILQPSNHSQIFSEGLPNQSSCQHIVIIQTANQSSPLQNIRTNVTAPPQTTTSNCTPATAHAQNVGGKHLVHILPRPQGPVVSSTSGSGQNPQTITVNGQVFALQTMTPSGGLTTQNALQIIQPTTGEDPSVTLNTLGALANLNQSITNVTSQNCLHVAVAPSSCPLAQSHLSVPTTVGNCSSSVVCPSISSISMGSSPVKVLHRRSNTLPTIKPKPKRLIAKRTQKISPRQGDVGLSQSTAFTGVVTQVTETTHQRPSKHNTTVTYTLQEMSASEICTVPADSWTKSKAVIECVSPTVSALTVTSDSSTSKHTVCISSGKTSVNSSVSSTGSLIICNTTGNKPLISVGSLSTIPTSDCLVGNSRLSPQPTSENSFSQNPQESLTNISSSMTGSLPATDISTSTSTTTTVTNFSSHLSGHRKSDSSSEGLMSQAGPVTSHLRLNQRVTMSDKCISDSSIEREPVPEKISVGCLEKSNVEVEVLLGKNSAPSLQVCTIDHEEIGPVLCSSQKPDTSISAVSSSSRDFSVASMLPPCHGVSAATSSFGTFTFSSEQAEILAIFEQESPGRKQGSCEMESPVPGLSSGLITGPTLDWDLSKQQQSSKEMITDSQPKLPKVSDITVTKNPSEVSIRELTAGIATTGILPISYSHPSQSQSSCTQLSLSLSQSSQSPTIDSLSVNNLVRPASSSQPYPCSPSISQQVPSSSPVAIAVPVSQPPALLPPCSSTGQLTPIKSALMRAAGNVTERRTKEVPKRHSQDDVMVTSGKRSKVCTPSTTGHLDIKATPPDHSQVMLGQLPSSSGISSRGHTSEGMSFMGTVLRQSDGHCGPPVLSQDLQQRHPQHSANQASHHHHHHNHHHYQVGNPYLKQQQQQEQQLQGQRQHFQQQIQHHLAQPDQSQLQSHQRGLTTDQKKRGMVRGGQQVAPMGLPAKQHQVEKNATQQLQQHQHQQPHPQQQQQQHQQHQHQPVQHQQHQQHQHHQQQSSQSRHQHLQQHLQQQHFTGRHQEKAHLHPQQQQDRQTNQSHNSMQRLHQITPQRDNTVSHPSDISCTPSRQERNRISSYSAEALIGKSSSNGEHRLGITMQIPRATQEQPVMRSYLDISHGKGNVHNPQGRHPPDHSTSGIQRVSDCPPFKSMAGGQQPLDNFEVQVSRCGDIAPKPGSSSHRGLQTQGYRIGERQPRGVYSAAQSVSSGAVRDQDTCHQTFMQSLLTPHIEQVANQRPTQFCPPANMEYCTSATTTGDIQSKVASPNVPPPQKPPSIRIGEGKAHVNLHMGGSMHETASTGRAGMHPPTPHSTSEAGHTPVSTRTLNSVGQRSRHLGQDGQNSKLRPGDRTQSGILRPGNTFQSEGHLALPTSTGVLLGRQQEARRCSIVRFMGEGTQVPAGDNLSEQHLTQNFGFFMAENPPTINANNSFIPPVTQTSTTRTPAILPVEPQNPLPSFYPSYSPAAHPSLPSDIPLQYFSNQIFTSPSAEKSGTTPLNNRFGSILSPPRPVGFPQASFPLLPEMPPMPIANSSNITPHISNFNLTSLFPEITGAMPTDGSSMPMSPLLSLTNTSSSDSGKQSTRPAHNISHILGHDGSSTI